MPDEPISPTVKELEAKIAALEKKLAAGEGLEARVMLALQDKIAALEAKLAEAKAGPAAPPPEKGFFPKLF